MKKLEMKMYQNFAPNIQEHFTDTEDKWFAYFEEIKYVAQRVKYLPYDKSDELTASDSIVFTYNAMGYIESNFKFLPFNSKWKLLHTLLQSKIEALQAHIAKEKRDEA